MNNMDCRIKGCEGKLIMYNFHHVPQYNLSNIRYFGYGQITIQEAMNIALSRMPGKL